MPPMSTTAELCCEATKATWPGSCVNCHAAIERGQADRDVYYPHGWARGAQKKFVEAEADFTTAIDRGMNNAEIYWLRGMVNYGKQDFVTAEVDFSMAVERGRGDADVYYFRGRGGQAR